MTVFIFFQVFLTPHVFAGDKNSKKTIRSIKIIVRDVFDEKEENGLIYRTANILKINTAEDIIKRELLFQEGDTYNKFNIAESGRNLRSLPFLRNITITEIVDGDFVDITVGVQDTWTLFPVIGLSSGGGTQKQSIGVTEGNLAGYGKRLELLFAEDENRRKYEAVWDDRRFLGSLQRFTLGHFERSDGRSSVVSWGLPFRSLVNKHAWFVEADSSDLIGRMFRNGDERYIFRQKSSSLMGGYTIAAGEPTELLNRLTLGYSFTDDMFSEATDSDYDDIGLDRTDVPTNDGTLASDRRFSGPVFSWQMIQPKFISLNYVDFFDRVQDFNLGNELVANLHISPEIIGSKTDALILRLSDSDGLKITPHEFIRGQVGFSTRIERDTLQTAVLSLNARYYNVTGPQYLYGQYVGQHTLAAAFSLDSGHNLDNDREFLLGASNGLRGYEDRTFTGSHRFNLNLEDRTHLVDDVLKLFNVGTALFADVGTTSDENLKHLVTEKVYANVGIGLRLGLTRSTGGTVVRIDLAVPLMEGPDGTSKFEPRLLFTTGQMFSGFLRSDAPGLTTPSISAGFAQ